MAKLETQVEQFCEELNTGGFLEVVSRDSMEEKAPTL